MKTGKEFMSYVNRWEALQKMCRIRRSGCFKLKMFQMLLDIISSPVTLSLGVIWKQFHSFLALKVFTFAVQGGKVETCICALQGGESTYKDWDDSSKSRNFTLTSGIFHTKLVPQIYVLDFCTSKCMWIGIKRQGKDGTDPSPLGYSVNLWVEVCH